MLTLLENRRKVNLWPWAGHGFGARVHASVFHDHLRGTAPGCKSGDSSVHDHVDAYVYADAGRGCGVGAVVRERA